MKYQISFFVGTQDKDGNEVPVEVYASIRRTLAYAFGGYSQTAVDGGWINPDTHNLIEETSYRFDVITESSDVVATARQNAETLRAVARQSAVLVTVTPLIFSEFVG